MKSIKRDKILSTIIILFLIWLAFTPWLLVWVARIIIVFVVLLLGAFIFNKLK